MSRKTERRKKKNCKGNKLPMDKVLMREAQDFFKIYKHDKTRNSYETNYKKYIVYCRQKHNAKSKADCEQYIQEYSDYLLEQGKSASTIHTYLAPVCIYHGIKMSEIKKLLARCAKIKEAAAVKININEVTSNTITTSISWSPIFRLVSG